MLVNINLKKTLIIKTRFMNNKFLLFITLLAATFTHAQNSFKGVVIEEDTSLNVTNAIVAIEGTAIAQRTDLNGAFNILKDIPSGDHVVTITKDGYVTKYILIQVSPGKNIILDNVKIEVNKQERKRREKAIKAQQKEEKKSQKEKDKFLKESQKEKEKRDKELEKQKKKLLKNKKDINELDIETTTPIEETPLPVITEITSLQIKDGAKLDVTPETISSSKLYEFIDSWDGTKYVLGGETREGIDCSSFTQRLYTSVYDIYLERTAQKQFDSKLTDKFLLKKFLREGDLIFFAGSGENKDVIVHVGIFLHNGYFVHATSYTKDNGLSGVQISNLTDSFWTRRFVAGGRR